MRSPTPRRWFVLFATCLCPALTIVAAPQWVSETWEDFRDYPELQRTLEVLREERVELDAESSVAHNRIWIKEGILDGLEMKTSTLHQAAERFLAMDREKPCFDEIYGVPVRVGSEIELAAIHVIRSMRTRCECGRTVPAGTLLRVESEFEREFGYQPPRN